MSLFETLAQPRKIPSFRMRSLSAVAGTLAQRGSKRASDLARDRRANDKFTSWLKVPDGAVLSNESIGGVPVIRVSSGNAANATVLHIHGGAYVMGTARQVLVNAALCLHGGPDLVSVEYRLAPEHPYPAALDDVFAVYRELVTRLGAERLVVLGESAGGGLLLLVLQRALSEGLPMPSVALAAYPWADLTMSGRSATANAGKDMLVRSGLLEQASWFAAELDAADARLSPVFGSFRGFPPTYIAVGSHDLLLDDARRVANAMKRDDVDVCLEEWPGAIHGFNAVPVPEAREYNRRIRSIIDWVLANEPRPDPN